MAGAGKSTVGRLLARRLGCGFADTDDDVCRLTGRTIPEIWADGGEEAFRAFESDALAGRLAPAADPARPAWSVLAVGGGAVVAAPNRATMRRAELVVWLRASIATLAARLGDGTGRPLIEVDPTAAIVRLEAARRPLYAQLADHVVDVDDRIPADIAEDIATISRQRIVPLVPAAAGRPPLGAAAQAP